MNDSQMRRLTAGLVNGIRQPSPPAQPNILALDHEGTFDGLVQFKSSYSRLYFFFDVSEVEPDLIEKPVAELVEAATEAKTTKLAEAKPAEAKPPAKPNLFGHVTIHGVCDRFRLPIVQRIKVVSGGFIEVPFLVSDCEVRVEVDAQIRFSMLGV